MWIRTTQFTDSGAPVPRRRDRPALSKPVVFNDSGTANVPEADAEWLLAHDPSLEPAGDEAADDEDDDADADADNAGGDDE